MPDPAALLAVARRLAETSPAAAEMADAHLRRAVSTAYYALFHTVLRAAAVRFMGIGQETSAGYNLIYRSFEHRRMRDVCQKLMAPKLSEALSRDLHRAFVSQDARDFAGAFPDIQQARNLADYDPIAAWQRDDVLVLIGAVEAAISAFHRTDPVEQADILALMMTRSRA